ncbi:hypothetical protein [Kineococcus xinjiangensis]|nr:hypothetical protein [Kineococcus xinjiangensis]
METVVVICPGARFGLEDLAHDLDGFNIALHGAVLTVSEDEGAAFLVEVDDVEADGVFEDWPVQTRPEGAVTVFALDSRSPTLTVRIVQALAGKRAFLVDTNHGRVVSGAALNTAMLAGQDGG